MTMSPVRGQNLDEDGTLPIAEVARHTGLSADTLRYYEKAGLIDSVRRTAGGVRRYSAADMEWLAFLVRLRDTGMSIADMQHFAALRREGNTSVPSRLALLRAHRHNVSQRLRSLRTNLRLLDKKIAHYQELLPDEADGHVQG
jgi:DNA-binding transcriptional MerR regulator